MSTRPLARLWVETRAGHRRAVDVQEGILLVGRGSGVDIPIDSESVSRHHADLWWDGSQLRIRDAGSTNGTWVRGERLIGWVSLRDGDPIRFGKVDAVVQIGELVAESGLASPEQLGGGAGVEHTPASDRLSEKTIFVSHASEDKQAARRIAAHLRRSGWTVWIDEAGIAGGKAWRAELAAALKQAWTVVLLVSTDSMRSKWVIREVEAADDLDKPIIPVMLEEAPYADPLRLILNRVQRIDVYQVKDADLTALDDALIEVARQAGGGTPGQGLVAVGSILIAIGALGLLVSFPLFAYTGWMEVARVGSSSDPFNGIPRPLLVWGLFMVSMVVAGTGQGVRRAGKRRGI